MYLMNINMREFRKKVQEEGINTVLIPIGMLEAHGEHCALGTDTLIPREFVRRLEERIGDKVMMAPEIPYGHSWALAPFPGTIDVPGRVFADYVAAVGEQFVRQGFKYVILFNGHGGNISALSLVSERLADLGAVVLTINWWLDYKDLIVQYAPATGHAGEDETSCVLAIDEALVDMRYAHSHTDSSISRKIRYRDMGLYLYPHGNNGDATKATREKGEQIFEALLPAIVRDIEEMWAQQPSV
jgi:creatinine amidohydrolase